MLNIKRLSNVCFTSKIEPKYVSEALNDEFLVNAMQEKLVQFTKNEVWKLVPRPYSMYTIATKWIFKSKPDEYGHVTWK